MTAVLVLIKVCPEGGRTYSSSGEAVRIDREEVLGTC
jgi:hypothetical protein